LPEASEDAERYPFRLRPPHVCGRSKSAQPVKNQPLAFLILSLMRTTAVVERPR
jgi:hypothetical protein